MKILKERIQKDGVALTDRILKVDSFINHQIDPQLMYEIGEEFAEYFKKYNITKVLTIEASGISMAVMTGLHLKVPVVFAKKHEALNLDKDLYLSKVFSFTKNKEYLIKVSKHYIDATDNVLIIDDFLANGKAAIGLADIVKQAEAKVCGIGIVIEKDFQDGGKILREQGFDVKSLAIIESLCDGNVSFK